MLGARAVTKFFSKNEAHMNYHPNNLGNEIEDSIKQLVEVARSHSYNASAYALGVLQASLEYIPANVCKDICEALNDHTPMLNGK